MIRSNARIGTVLTKTTTSWKLGGVRRVEEIFLKMKRLLLFLLVAACINSGKYTVTYVMII